MLAPLCFALLSLATTVQQGGGAISASDLYKAASPSVVTIELYGDDGKVPRSGSGFIVSPDGEILTNYHVIAHSKRATVRLANGDAYDDVTVLDLDKRKDIALIKIEAVDLTPLKPGHSASVQVGDKLYVLGNPLGLFENTLSEGILSGIRQADGYKLFQISTPISSGSSGSPVFDAQGEVVGIVKATMDEGQALNFAIPIDYAAGMLGAQHTPRSLAAIYEPPGPAAGNKSNSNEATEPTTAAEPSDALKSDAPDYLAQRIGMWAKNDADKELGEPYAQRNAVYKSEVFADIFKYKSPSSGFSSIELSFNRKTGKMEAAYLYPHATLNWEAIKASMGRRYKKEKGKNGAVFYDYQVGQHTVSFYVDSLDDLVSIGVF
jgi:hypothetical protein